MVTLMSNVTRLLPKVFCQHQQMPSLHCKDGTEAASDMFTCLFTLKLFNAAQRWHACIYIAFA